MSRVTTIICGLLLFGLGLFLGMVGSFVHTLSPETPQASRSAPRAVLAANQPQRVGQLKLSKVAQPPLAVESALSEALTMVAVALASQPATSAPPVAVVSADTATNAPEQHPLELLMPTAASETAQVEPPAAAPLPPPSPPNPVTGHWVLDERLGWLWLSENTSSVVIVPVIEVFPGGLITIHAGSKSAASRTSRKSAPTPPPPQPRKGSVIQHDPPGSKQSPAVLPFPRKQ